MKLKVEMSSFYGCNCVGCGYSSECEQDITISEELAKVVKREIDAHDGSLTNDEMRGLINSGMTELEPLHEELWDMVVLMDIEYWLEQGDDGCGTIQEWMSKDIESGKFVPKTSFEDYLIQNGIDTKDEDYNEEDCRWDYKQYVLDEEYRSWVADLDQWDRADRYGLNIYAVINDCRGEYVITIDEE